jgi:hypothetical protein
VDDHRDEPELTDLIAGSARSHGELARLAHRLARRAWPADGRDRTQPSAREWLRLWGPVRLPAERLLPTCRCAHGRCGVCN